MTTHEANSNYSMGRLEKWKKALNQVANLSGFHVNQGDEYQYKFIEEIVEEISTKIKPLTLHVADCLVGLQSRMKDVISLLNLGSNHEIHMVGIHGIGGVGKTTLAVAIYNSIASQFKGSCYLENVRENFVKHGLTYLQEIVLSKTVGGKKIELTSFREGIETIKQRLGQKKILLLLDDVDKLEQLEAIAGSRDWFGPGSRVIITTRDTGLLTCHEVEPYEVNELNKKDASELLRQKAIRTNKVTPSYIDVLNRVLTYASGLPLALEVIGSHLFKKTVEECKDILDRYERIPHPKIQTILEVSFDALDKEEKCVFLDIACIFKGHELTNVEKILHAHYGDSRKHHLNVLVEKSLIKISESGHVTLHDLIADMGEEIVRQESPDEPGRRSRLWLPKDIVEVLEENRGTSKIEMIYFDSWIEVKWNGEAFKKMENLKTLIITHGASLKSPKHLPNSLRVLEWQNYSGDLPSDFYPKKLVICKSNTNSTSFMREGFFKKKFETMRILKVEFCNFLTQIPDISGLVNLEEISLKSCNNLIRIDDSVGLLNKLKTLTLYRCMKLNSIPPLKLPSLEEFHLSFCHDLKSLLLLQLPSLELFDLGNCFRLENIQSLDGLLLGSLKFMRIQYCEKLRSIPPLKLTVLEKFSLFVCDGLESFPPVLDVSMANLKILHFSCCNYIKSFPSLKLPSLEELCIECCGLESFSPVVDGLLGKLKLLSVNCCKNLKSIQPLKLPLLEKLTFSECDSLESFPLMMDESLDKLKSLTVKSCRNLKSFLQLKLPSLETLDLSDCGSLENFLPLVDGWMRKLKVLEVVCCHNCRSMPRIKFASLEKLVLSYDCCCNTIQDIDELHWDGLESFPPVLDVSMANLQILKVTNCSNIKSLPPLKLPSLEKLHLSYCDGLESFLPVVDGLLGKLKTLCVMCCRNLKSISPLKLPLLEKLELLNCFSLESFPLVMDGSFGKLKSLTVKSCRNLKSFLQLKLPSLETLDLSNCGGLENFLPLVDGWVGKLKVLRVICCRNHRSIPPIKFASLEELELSCDCCRDDIPKIEELHWDDTPLKELPFSFQDLNCLQTLYLKNCGIVQFPTSSIVAMSKLVELTIKYGGWTFPMQSSRVELLRLPSVEEFNLSNCDGLESFPPVLAVSMGNLKILHVGNCSNIKSLPPLKLHSLQKLHLSYCHGLESFIPVVDGLLGKLKVLHVVCCRNLKSIPPLKLPLLEELTLEYCDSLESFPLVMDGSLGRLKSLTVKSCKKLKSFLQLKLASLETLDLSDCGSLESFLPLVYGWMRKLKVLEVVCCHNCRSMPPIKFASLEKLVLSCDCCCNTIQAIKELHWDDIPLKELPFSFQDLTCLQKLYLQNCAIVQFPTSNIVTMSKQDKDEEKVIPIQSSRVELLSFWSCNLSDESLAIGLKWFANVKELDLSYSEFTTLPECIKNCHFLWKLVIDDCEKLEEIKGIPPNVKTISAFNCSSLTSSRTSKLLNQELHKFGNTNFILPGVEIPNWFDSGYMQLSVSFWFRNKFPAIALCAVSTMTCNDSQVCLKVTINNMEYFYKDGIHIDHYEPRVYHLWLFHMQNQKFHADLDIELLENKWNRAVIDFEFGIFNSGIYVLKEISSMEDIRFDNPENEVNI